MIAGRPRPQALWIAGPGCCAFAVAYLGWLLLYRWADLVAMASGNADALTYLGGRHLVRTGAVRLIIAHVTVEFALSALLAAAGWGLTVVRPWARWWAFAAGGAGMAVALLHTAVHMSAARVPGEVIPLTPLLMDAVAVLFGIVLCGTMFLPSVSDAYAGLLEPPLYNQPSNSGLESRL